MRQEFDIYAKRGPEYRESKVGDDLALGRHFSQRVRERVKGLEGPICQEYCALMTSRMLSN